MCIKCIKLFKGDFANRKNEIGFEIFYEKIYCLNCRNSMHGIYMIIVLQSNEVLTIHTLVLSLSAAGKVLLQSFFKQKLFLPP